MVYNKRLFVGRIWLSNFNFGFEILCRPLLLIFSKETVRLSSKWYFTKLNMKYLEYFFPNRTKIVFVLIYIIHTGKRRYIVVLWILVIYILFYFILLTQIYLMKFLLHLASQNAHSQNWMTLKLSRSCCAGFLIQTIINCLFNVRPLQRGFFSSIFSKTLHTPSFANNVVTCFRTHSFVHSMFWEFYCTCRTTISFAALHPTYRQLFEINVLRWVSIGSRSVTVGAMAEYGEQC